MDIGGYINEVLSFPNLDLKVEGGLARKASRGDEDSRSRLINAYLKLVVSIALRYQHRAPLGDLIQEGNIALLRATYEFNPSKKILFFTYARKAIVHAMDEALAQEEPFGVSREHVLLRRSVDQAQEGYLQETGGDHASLEELTRRVNKEGQHGRCRPARIGKLLMTQTVSLQTPLDTGEEKILQDCLPDQSTMGTNPEEKVIQADSDHKVHALIESTKALSLPERSILTLRLQDETPTLKEMANTAGIPRGSVHGKESQARAKVKNRLQTQALEFADFYPAH